MIDERRRRRVQRLKKIIVFSFAAAVVIPVLFCIVLLIQARGLKAQIRLLEEEKEIQAAAMLDRESAGSIPENGKEELTEADSIRRWEAQKESTGQDAAVTGIRKVYLTFDDGPSMYTDEILDILDTYGVKATFFVVGKGKEPYEDAYRRIVAEGHTLGMHSYSHKYTEIYASKEAYVKDLNLLQDYLYEVTGTHAQICRFPGGSSNRASKVDMEELIDYLQEIDVVYYDWNISSGDATGHNISPDRIVENASGNLDGYKEAVILFHDSADKRTTVDALPQIIETILAMEDTVIVPITEETVPVQHRKK